MESIVGILFSLFALYLLVGLIFYFIFLSKGMKTIDDATDGVKVGFKLLILPGTLLLWPFLLAKWRRTRF